MRYINTIEEYEHFKSIWMSTIIPESKLPNQVFQGHMGHWVFLTTDLLLSRQFYRCMKRFMKETGEKEFYLSSVDPNPESYYYSYYNNHCVAAISVDGGETTYIRILNESPVNNPADTLANRPDVYLVCSCSSCWAIYGDRMNEISICAFSNLPYHETFRKAFAGEYYYGGNQLCYGLDGASEMLELSLKRDKIKPFMDQMRKNYR